MGGSKDGLTGSAITNEFLIKIEAEPVHELEEKEEKNGGPHE